ncbi:uncharacterized protein LOC135155051 [Lytechinus pictus]|uniref:uncharacterized protein LOC135155051 n=1 Tax=Lytechinus pictus TaxID=7653 RepID=UPI0030B9BCF9
MVHFYWEAMNASKVQGSNILAAWSTNGRIIVSVKTNNGSMKRQIQTQNMAVSKYQGEAEKGLRSLEQNLIEIPKDMVLFSLSLRSLYAENAVGGNDETTEEFRKLRDLTRDDAMVYLHDVLPVATSFISTLNDFFEIYKALTYEQWCEMFQDIQHDVISYKSLAQIIVTMHEDLLVELKKRQDEATVIVKKVKGLQEEYEKEKERLEKKADVEMKCGIGLAFVPWVGPFICAALEIASAVDLAAAIAKAEEGINHKHAAMAVSTVLIPALGNFIDGLQDIAAFFSVTEVQLKSLERDLDDNKKIHFLLFQSKSKEIQDQCKKYFAVLPSVRSDLKAIPTEGTDMSYVDKWLEEQKKAIKEKYGSDLVEMLVKAITEN